MIYNMNKAFYKKIINLIPSEDMKSYIKQNDFEFNEKDLLKIILDYSPTFDDKLRLFEEASTILYDKKLRTLAKKRLDFEKKQYNAFIQTDPNVVFQIIIKIKTDYAIGDEDSYITKSFDDAIILIKKYLKYYEIKPKELADARFIITKKTTNAPDKPSDFFYKYNKVGDLGKCVLDNKLRIIYLDMYNFGIEVKCKSDIDCDECNRCIRGGFTTHFPHFLQKFDLIAYYDDLLYNPKHLIYGVFTLDMEDCDYDSYVIDFEESPYIKNRNGYFKDENGYYSIYDSHDHPSCFEIIKPDIKNVSNEILEDYNYTVSVLKKIEEIRANEKI